MCNIYEQNEPTACAHLFCYFCAYILLEIISHQNIPASFSLHDCGAVQHVNHVQPACGAPPIEERLSKHATMAWGGPSSFRY
ncbi:hypothetical protein JTE90_007729 [Oedothorax gibbosus]|uniref:Uncharacterized protein n=1 Tax=Oedothorax gibbosus TaxID=931172 RepID=A0AAV6V778_9ARAC|nr:hypothetical protein JTE90_007729 [Oedothorax gibbosus]